MSLEQVAGRAGVPAAKVRAIEAGDALTDEQLAARRNVLAFIEAAGLQTPGLAEVSVDVEPAPGDLDP